MLLKEMLGLFDLGTELTQVLLHSQAEWKNHEEKEDYKRVKEIKEQLKTYSDTVKKDFTWETLDKESDYLLKLLEKRLGN